MRDPARIPKVLELLHKAWLLHPDQRLGQLILNACREKTPLWPDVFNVEDEVMQEALQELVAQGEAFAGREWVLYRERPDGHTEEVLAYETPWDAELARKTYAGLVTELGDDGTTYWVEEREVDPGRAG